MLHLRQQVLDGTPPYIFSARIDKTVTRTALLAGFARYITGEHTECTAKKELILITSLSRNAKQSSRKHTAGKNSEH